MRADNAWNSVGEERERDWLPRERLLSFSISFEYIFNERNLRRVERVGHCAVCQDHHCCITTERAIIENVKIQ